MPFNNEDEIESERKKWALTEEKYQKNFDSIFNELILIGNATQTDTPSLIMVGGQAGAGKSMLVSKEGRNLENGSIAIDQDVLRTKHPYYNQIHDNYTEREEFLLLKTYVNKLVKDIIEKGSDERYNIILESALRSVSNFINYIKDVKQKEYGTKLSLLAASPDEANLSMFTRFCTFLQKDGDCRRNTRVDNASVKKIPLNIEKMENLDIFDDITISVRGNKSTEFLPVELYSKLRAPNTSAARSYINIVNNQQVNSDEFESRYLELREILQDYNQEVQLKRLDDFHKDFNSRKNKTYPSLDE